MKLTPSYEEINKSVSPFPTLGELHLIRNLKEILSDVSDLEIIYQPKIGRGRADVILLRKGYGCAIIEVKDWIVNSYNVTKGKGSGTSKWHSKQGAFEVYSPHRQVHSYKEDLIEEARLSEQIDADPKAYGVIRTLLYFANTPHIEAESYSEAYIKCYGRGGWPTPPGELLQTLGLDFKRDLFSDDVYQRIRDVIVPKRVPDTPSIPVRPTQRQRDALAIPLSGRRKIRGSAGSGKTYVGAIIAAQSAQRKEDVLVLVYNEAAKWGFQEVVRHLDLEFNRSFVTVLSIFKLTKPFSQNVEERHARAKDFFETSQDMITKRLAEQHSHPQHMLYDTIIIDEAQDYRLEWMQLLEKHYLRPGGRLIILADEGQNIYGNALEEQRVRTPISGAWFRLGEHNRASPEISAICDQFRNEFFNDSEQTEMPPSLGLSVTNGYELSSVHREMSVPIMGGIKCLSAFLEQGPSAEAPLIIARTNRLLRGLEEGLALNNRGTGKIRCTAETELERIETFFKVVTKFATKTGATVHLNGTDVSDEFLDLICSSYWRQLHLQPVSDWFRQVVAKFQYEIKSASQHSPMYVHHFAKSLYAAMCSFEDGTSATDTETKDWSTDIAHSFSFELSKIRTAHKSEIFQSKDDLALSTPHTSKGIERSATIVIVDDYWDKQPNAHQLLYTALSRAKNELHVVYDARSSYADFFKRHLQH
jgi:hypothetical protein